MDTLQKEILPWQGKLLTAWQFMYLYTWQTNVSLRYRCGAVNLFLFNVYFLSESSVHRSNPSFKFRLKIRIEPENHLSGKENHIPNLHFYSFLGSMWIWQNVRRNFHWKLGQFPLFFPNSSVKETKKRNKKILQVQKESTQIIQKSNHSRNIFNHTCQTAGSINCHHWLISTAPHLNKP